MRDIKLTLLKLGILSFFLSYVSMNYVEQGVLDPDEFLFYSTASGAFLSFFLLGIFALLEIIKEYLNK